MPRKKTSFAELVTKGERKTKPYRFMGSEIDIMPLSVTEVKKFQAAMKQQEEESSDDDSEAGLAAQRDLIRTGVVGAEDLSDEQLDQLPLADITKLANEVLKHAGLSQRDSGSN